VSVGQIAVGPAAGAVSSRRPRRGDLKRAQRRWGIAFSTPVVLYFALFWLFPLVLAIYYSFTNYDLVQAPQWVGLQNYRNLFSNPAFWQSVRVSLLYTVGTVVPTLVIALALAVPLAKPGRFNGTMRILMFIPTIVPLVGAAFLWQVIYSPNGLANTVIGWFGFAPVSWLQNPNVALWSIVIMVVWKTLGIFVLIFLAGLQTIPGNVYEAARIDGAGTARVFVRITLPLLRRTLLFVLVIAIIGAMQSFVPAYLLTGGGPSGATTVLPVFLYENAFSYTLMGYASAISVVLFVALGGFSWFLFRVLREKKED
jgi:multiple sugar transport system permease protein